MIQLRQYQTEAVDAVEAAWERGVQRPLVALPTGCHAAGTPVLTHDGSIRPVECVQVGDLLMGPDSTPRTVLRLVRGHGEMRRIVPIKGEPWVVNLDHVLTLVQTNTEGVPTCPAEARGGSVVDVTVREWETWSKWRRHIFKLFRAPVAFPDRHPPCLDPWLMGVLLGDGHLAQDCFAAWAKPDLEVVQRARAIALTMDLEVVSDGIIHRLSGRRGCRNPVIDALRSYELAGISGRARFVPDDFKLGSAETRLGVLAGLLDSDGHLNGGGYEFTSVSKRLACDVAFMARSLGMRAVMSERRLTTNFAPDGVVCWRVSISGDCSWLPLAIDRKCAPERLQKKDPLRTGFRVEPAPDQDYFGFTLDGDGRYLLGDFTVTHNSGKTILFAELIRRRPGRSLVLAHREELLQQAANKIRMVTPDADVGLVRADTDEHRAQVVVASVQTLSRPERLRRLDQGFDVVIVDEGHHASAPTYLRVLNRFDEAASLGVTATPERSDKQRLQDVWDEIVYRRTLPEMIRAGYLCDLRAVRVGLALDLGRVRTRDGDFSEADLERELEAADAPRHVVDAYQRHAEGRKALLFTAGVQLAHEMAEALEAAGVPAAAVDGSTPREERAQLLRAFHAGDIRVLANCGVLTEGYDEPSTECLMLVRPTKSRVLYAQMVGRGTRRHPGKQDCLIVDLVGNSERHDLASIGSLFGFEPPEGESVIEAMDAHGRSAVEPSDIYGPQQAGGELVARTVELFDARRFSWACGDGLFVLPAGDSGQVAVQEVQAGWRVWQLRRDGQQLVADGLDLDYAQGTAEDMVRRLGGAGLAKRDAAWRSSPASEGQLQALQRMGVAANEDVTRGEASNLMTLEIARRALEPATDRQRGALRRRGVEVPAELTKQQAMRLLAGERRSA